jgi:hypothetical protein
MFWWGEGRQYISAHTAAWLLAGRNIPDGHEICHKCHVRPCVNIDHLTTGTGKENVAMSNINGDWHHRLGKPQALTDAQYLEIHSLKHQTGKEIARQYGISERHACRIKNGWLPTAKNPLLRTHP